MRGVSKEKTERLEIRLTPDEKSTLFKLAKIAGVSVSAYILGEALGDMLGQQIMKGFNLTDDK